MLQNKLIKFLLNVDRLTDMYYQTLNIESLI